MKKIFNSVFAISEKGHFIACPHETIPTSMEADIQCRCSERCYSLVFAIGLSMFAFEFLGGAISGSLSLFGDSLHLFSDSLAACIGFLAVRAVRMKKEGSDKLIQYAVLANGILLAASSAYLLYESFGKFLRPSGVSGTIVLIVASVGVAGNLAQHHILSSTAGVYHSGGLLKKSISLHILSDLAQSIVVVVGGIWMMTAEAKTGKLIDPFLSTGIGFIMIMYALNLVIKSFSAGRGSHDEHHHH